MQLEYHFSFFSNPILIRLLFCFTTSMQLQLIILSIVVVVFFWPPLRWIHLAYLCAKGLRKMMQHVINQLDIIENSLVGTV